MGNEKGCCPTVIADVGQFSTASSKFPKSHSGIYAVPLLQSKHMYAIPCASYRNNRGAAAPQAEQAIHMSLSTYA